MLRRFTRKRWLAALAAVAALVVAGAALAYFTAGGSGTGSAKVGTVTAGVVITGDLPSAALYPGGSAVTVPIHVQNTTSQAVNVGTVTLDSITSDKAGCDLSLTGAKPAFTMADVPVNETLAAQQISGVHNGSLQMNDTGSSQDACQGAALTLHFTSTAGS